MLVSDWLLRLNSHITTTITIHVKSRTGNNVVVKTFLGLDTQTFAIRSRDQDRDLDIMNSSALESRDHGLEITSLAASIPILATEHSLIGSRNYGNRATGVGTKHAVLRPRPRQGRIQSLSLGGGAHVERPSPPLPTPHSSPPMSLPVGKGHGREARPSPWEGRPVPPLPSLSFLSLLSFPFPWPLLPSLPLPSPPLEEGVR